MTRRGAAACAVGLVTLACAGTLFLAGCQDSQPAGQQSASTVNAAQPSQSDASASSDSGANASAPSIKSSTITLSSDMLLLLGIEDPQATLESLGCTDVTQNEDGAFTAHVTSEVYANIVSVYYQQITTFFDALPQNEVYPRVESCSYDESFATLVFVLRSDSLADEDMTLQGICANAAMHYQQMANLPQECTVVLVSSSGEELSSTTFTGE